MDHTRHIGIFSAEGWQATIIGAGGIGAITALVLAKMGLDLTIVDDDTVDEVNLATQFHYRDMVGEAKTVAVSKLLYDMADVSSVTIFDRVTEENAALFRAPIIISAVDSINARKAIWAGLKDQHWMWYIDARMGAETFVRYVVDGDDSRVVRRSSLPPMTRSLVPDLTLLFQSDYLLRQFSQVVFWDHDVRKIITGETPPKMLALSLPDYTLFDTMSFEDIRDVRRIYDIHDVLGVSNRTRWMVCPLPGHVHNSNTASFSIYWDEEGVQRFKCHGNCGLMGDVVDLVGYLEVPGYDPRSINSVMQSVALLGGGA